MSLFSKITSAVLSPVAKLFGVENPDLTGAQQGAFENEMARIKARAKDEREKSRFLANEGEGIAHQADFAFGDELDLEDLTDKERTERGSGRLTRDTGLVL